MPLDHGSKTLSRRDWLKMASAGGAGALLAACVPQFSTFTPEPTQTVDIEGLKMEAKQDLLGQLTRLGMQEIHRQTLGPSDIPVTVFTDNPEALKFHPDKFNDLFEQFPKIIDQVSFDPQSDSLSRERLKDVYTNAASGNSQGFEIYLGIPSIPQSCFVTTEDDPDSSIRVIPSVVTNAADFCRSVGKTSTGIIPRVLERPIASFVVVTAASDISGKAILSPSDGEFTLTPEQSVASTLYHELWHILIKLKTNSQLPGEEIFVQELEKLRLQLIQEGKIEEFLPIEFIKPQGSIDRFRRGRPKKLEVVNFFGPRIMEA